jgi:hypothetical protein
VRAAKLAVYCIVEVEGQQRRTVPVAGASGEHARARAALCWCRKAVRRCMPHCKHRWCAILSSPCGFVDVLWNEELTFKTVRSTADLRVSVFARMRLGSDAFLGELEVQSAYGSYTVAQ